MSKSSGSFKYFEVTAQIIPDRWPNEGNAFLTDVKLTLKGVSKAIFDLVLYSFREGTKSSYHEMVKSDMLP